MKLVGICLILISMVTSSMVVASDKSDYERGFEIGSQNCDKPIPDNPQGEFDFGYRDGVASCKQYTCIIDAHFRTAWHTGTGFTYYDRKGKGKGKTKKEALQAAVDDCKKNAGDYEYNMPGINHFLYSCTTIADGAECFDSSPN